MDLDLVGPVKLLNESCNVFVFNFSETNRRENLLDVVQGGLDTRQILYRQCLGRVRAVVLIVVEAMGCNVSSKNTKKQIIAAIEKQSA